ncbi:MAG: tetratricopeptide repeat protein [Acidobacteriota bacterium]
MTDPLLATPSAVDGLRALRRGILRSEGEFALFVAVCNRPASRTRLIELLRDSIPGEEMETVELEQGVADPLGAVVERATDGNRGPLHVVGLELAIPDAEAGRPALLALNLERAEWPERLPRPVILWVPEFLLEILGREAADFLDWRSDTVHFAGERLVGLEAMDSALWQGEGAAQMPSAAREARIEELRSRLESTRKSLDPVARQSHALWLQELGRHLLFFGRLTEAEGAHRQAIAAFEELGNSKRLAASYSELSRILERRGLLDEADEWMRRAIEILDAAEDGPAKAHSYHRLGFLAQERGDLGSAERWYRQSLDLRSSLGDRHGIARLDHQLGVLAQLRADLASAEEWYRRSLELFESLGDRSGMARSSHQLAMVAQERGDSTSAETWCRRSLELFESLGDRPGMAAAYHQLGLVAHHRGDLPMAEDWYRRSLEILDSVGDLSGMATSYHQLGMVAQDRGDFSTAESWYRRSLELEESLGDRRGMAFTYGLLGYLAETRGLRDAALEWTVRGVTLFPGFPHPFTGPGPVQLVRLSAELGLEALEGAWRRVTGEELPGEVREWVEERMAEADAGEEGHG